MVTEQEIREAYLFLRKNNQSVSDETLDFMRDVSLRELKRDVDTDFIIDLLKLAVKYEIEDNLLWDDDLSVAILCNDVFFWATADAEEITKETLLILEKSLEDDNRNGAILYCARQRKMRPQGAIYKHLDEDKWHLYNECGSEREVRPGNPHKPGE